METSVKPDKVHTETQVFNNQDTNEHCLKKRLSHGCTHLMYACQQGLTDEIAKELRNKVGQL